MFLTENAHPHSEWDVSHREWRCDSPGMHFLTGNGNLPHQEWDVPHREWGRASLGMHILTRNAHSFYRVNNSREGLAVSYRQLTDIKAKPQSLLVINFEKDTSVITYRLSYVP